MFAPGDVIGFWSEESGKRKFHLCISLDGHFIFLSSPKVKVYPTDLPVSCSEFPFLKPTPSGFTIISCVAVMKKSNAELARCGATLKGRVSKELMRRLVDFVMKSPVLSEEDREKFLVAAGDWI